MLGALLLSPAASYSGGGALGGLGGGNFDALHSGGGGGNFGDDDFGVANLGGGGNSGRWQTLL